jgi:hypothetical protein
VSRHIVDSYQCRLPVFERPGLICHFVKWGRAARTLSTYTGRTGTVKGQLRLFTAYSTSCDWSAFSADGLTCFQSNTPREDQLTTREASSNRREDSCRTRDERKGKG